MILSQGSGLSFRQRSLIVIAAVLVLFGGALTAFGTVSGVSVYPDVSRDVTETLVTPVPGPILKDPAAAILRETRIRSGDTVASLFSRMGISDAEALAFLQNDRIGMMLFKQLVPGRILNAGITADGGLDSLSYPLNGGNATLRVQRTQAGFDATSEPTAFEKIVTLRSALIRHSLFGAADDAGIPDSVAIRLADIFGGDIDFHRDLRKGDRFSVIYESLTHLGKEVRPERILAAEFVNDGKTYRAFWFEEKDGAGGYYTAEGQNLKKAFLRSPLEFSRVTSGFANARYHPVLQEIRAHRGIDYGAPTGTRVRATGDGIVDFSGNQGGYGKVVMIRHSANRMTVYGHLSGFPASIRKGARVAQGETIGFVGATGLATGPHLHYEFRVAGEHRNPLTVTLPVAEPLASSSLPRFRAHLAEMTVQMGMLQGTQLAVID